MYQHTKPFLLVCITPLHAGSGSKVGLVDLPIQREVHTQFPKIESSGHKGAMRSTLRTLFCNDKEKNAQLIAVMGSEPPGKNEVTASSSTTTGHQEAVSDSNTSPGAVALSDARILLFPVRSMQGVFAYVTCPFVLDRLNREMAAFGLLDQGYESLPIPDVDTVTNQSKIILHHLEDSEPPRVLLEEYAWEVKQDEETDVLAQRLANWMGVEEEHLSSRLMVVSDDDFLDFVTLSTEVNTRIRIKPETGIVDDGALWSEENVPSETVFYGYLFSGAPTRKDTGLGDAKAVEQFLVKELPNCYQVGGNSSIGRGLMRHIWWPEGGKRDAGTIETSND